MWIAMWYGFAFSKLGLHVKNQSMLKSNDKSRSIDQERPVNTNSSSISFFGLDKDYSPRQYDKSNKTLSSTQTSASYPGNSISQNFLLNEHLTCQYCNKTYKTETGLNGHKAQCKERGKLSDNNKHNIQSTSNDNDFPNNWTTLVPNRQQYLAKLHRKNTMKLFSGVKLFPFTFRFEWEEIYWRNKWLLNEWFHDSPLNGILFKAVMLMSNLLLQKSSKNSKSKDHQLALEDRLELWHKGEFEQFYFEGETVQTSIKTTKNYHQLQKYWRSLSNTWWKSTSIHH